MNLGQLVKMVRSEFLVDARGLNKMRGQPFRAGEIEAAVLDLLPGAGPSTISDESEL